MSSTKKTKYLRLNKWHGSDKPMREDFNNDNELIDRAVREHQLDNSIHITADERDKWNTFVKAGMYFGDGTLERTIELDCDFDISFAIIFARSRPVSTTRFSDSKNYNYTAFISRSAATTGAQFGKNFKSIIVNQSATAALYNEYMNLNEAGVAYAYILFR